MRAAYVVAAEIEAGKGKVRSQRLSYMPHAWRFDSSANAPT